MVTLPRDSETNDLVMKCKDAKATNLPTFRLFDISNNNVSGFSEVFFKSIFLFNFHCFPDRDECQNSANNDCDQNAICNNTIGSFECFCKKGFTGNGKTCSGNEN